MSYVCNVDDLWSYRLGYFDRTKLLLITNRKLHTRFRLVPKSTTLDDHDRQLDLNRMVQVAEFQLLNDVV